MSSIEQLEENINSPKQLEPDDEDGGMSERDFRTAQENRVREILRWEAREREYPDHLRFVFRSAEDRDKALGLLDDPNIRRFAENEPFLYLQKWSIDPDNKNVGIKMDFQKHPRGLLKRVEEFFKEHELIICEKHEIVERELENPEKLFFIFENTGERDEALRFLNDPDLGIQHPLFKNLKQPVVVDPQRRDVGIEMDFEEHPRGLRQRVEDFFKQRGFMIREEYEVMEEGPADDVLLNE